MGKKGGTYYSAERLAKIVAQAKAAGRRELVDELRATLEIDCDGALKALQSLLRGIAIGYRASGRGADREPFEIARGLDALSSMRAVTRIIDQEVINEPGF